MDDLTKAFERLKKINEENLSIKNKRQIIYSDDNWIIEILSDTNFNPIIRVSSFKDGHFVDDLELSRQMFEDSTMIDEIKELIYI